MPEYNLTSPAANADAAIASAAAGKSSPPEKWPTNVVAAVGAVKALADLSKADDVEVSVAYSVEGGWAVVRVAPIHREE